MKTSKQRQHKEKELKVEATQMPAELVDKDGDEQSRVASLE